MTEHGPHPCSRCGAPLEKTALGAQCARCSLEWALEGGEAEPEPGLRTFGAYTLVHELGRGGMGVVWKAWDPRLRRHVALKVLLSGAFASPDFTRRFRDEASLAARVHHPGLVAIHEAGEVDGQAFYTMELVDGRSLAEVVRDRPLTAETAAQWLKAVAEAVAAAHADGVLHRDLKPSNILVGADGRPKVADFGLAKALGGAADLTRTADTAGSPPYMAPEQVEARTGGAPAEAADVYALGAVLYHALTGRPPFQGETVAQILTQVVSAAPVPPRRLLPGLPRDLETICLKCLEKEPTRRHGSAAELAADLGRFLAGEPVKARPLGPAGRLGRWARRKPALAATAAALVATWLGGTFTVLHQARQNARTAAHLADERYALNVAGAARAFLGGDSGAAPGDIAETRRLLAEADPDRRGFEWRWLWHESRPRHSRVLGDHGGYVQALAASSDGQFVASSGFNDETKLWPLHGAAPGRLLSPVFTEALAFTPGNDRLLLFAPGRERAERTLRRLPLAGGPAVESPLAARQAVLSADGRYLATLDVTGIFFAQRADGRLRVWLAASDVAWWDEVPFPASRAAFSPDGTLLAAANVRGEVTLWHVPTRSARARWQLPAPHAGRVFALAFAPGAETLAAGTHGAAFLLDVARTDTPPVPLPHTPGHDVLGLAFSPDGHSLATACTDHAVRLWTELGSPRPTAAVLRGHGDEVWCAVWPAGAPSFVTGGKDGRLLVWTPGEGPDRPEVPATSWQRPLFSPDGAHLVAGGPSAFRLHPLPPAGDASPLPGASEPLGHTADGRLVRWCREPAALESAGPSPADAPERVPLPDLGKVTHPVQLCLLDGGTKLSALNDDSRWQLFDTRSGKLLRSTPLPAETAHTWRDTRHSPDGRWIACGGSAPPYDVWLVATATGAVTRLAGHHDEVNGLDFSPDGRLLASASTDHEVRVWDVSTLTCLTVLAGHRRTSNGVAFSPDGRTLATVGALQSVKFWHTTTWHELATVDMPEAGSHLAFAPDGRWLAVQLETGSQATHLRLLHAPSP